MSIREFEACWYCGAAVNMKSSRGDHMPLPADCGGTATVPCCSSCHDMKDRIALDNWPAGFMNEVFKQLNGQPREIKIFIAKASALFARAIRDRNEAGQ